MGLKVVKSGSPSRDGGSGAPEITPAMIDAGEIAILGEVGGADLGGLFSAADLAIKVYQAMSACSPKPRLSREHGPTTR